MSKQGRSVYMTNAQWLTVKLAIETHKPIDDTKLTDKLLKIATEVANTVEEVETDD